MARTYPDLWPRFLTWRNWLVAYHRCRRRKRFHPAAAQFDFDWEAGLLALRRELAEGTYRPGVYRHFTIHEPKTRLISAAPYHDRIVHHAIVNLLEPLFERRFMYDSYACRRGKGTHRAIARAQQYLRRYPWYLKTDIVKFFPSIDHELLLEVVGRVVTDPRVSELLRMLLSTGVEALPEPAPRHYFPGDDLFAILRPRGLPIGNLTSQFLANVFLDPIDHFVKEELRVPGYVRYCDDLLLFGNSKAEMWAVAETLRQRFAEVRLRLHSDKTQVAPTRHGVKFLGFRVLPRGVKMTRQGIQRFVRRRRRQQALYARHELTASEVTRSLNAWLAHARRACAPGLRRALLKQCTLTRRRIRPPQQTGQAKAARLPAAGAGNSAPAPPGGVAPSWPGENTPLAPAGAAATPPLAAETCSAPPAPVHKPHPEPR
jgi:RNA-directed DNA polymerase